MDLHQYQQLKWSQKEENLMIDNVKMLRTSICLVLFQECYNIMFVGSVIIITN